MEESTPFTRPADNQPKSRRGRANHLTVAIALPWLIFFLVTLLFLLTYHELPALVWCLVVLFVLLSALFFGLGIVARRPIFMALGFVCFVSVALSTVLGLWLEDQYLARYYQLEGGAEYKDVDPAVIGNKTVDAAVIRFKNGTFVDDRRTLGFINDGSIFCVAPVCTPGKYMKEVQYWAAGRGCCQQRTNFDCGSAREYGQFASLTLEPTEEMALAVLEAEAVYGLNSSATAQLVSFISHPHTVMSDLWEEALSVAVVACMLDLFLCVSAGLIIAKAFVPRASSS
mmetsp:Transcript_73372/g.159102  ORF Transcript_73372/g.159102 Transcript_73372/m.159102 type:complete len:285 (+) Transcript_73372:109-963(+)